jgi:hypothetical protein
MPLSLEQCRWPPVYDFRDLGEQIQKLVSTQEIFSVFFDRYDHGPHFAQGDLLAFPGDFPFIDQAGNIQIFDNFDYWLVVGNTCDIDRTLPSPHFTHITPLVPLGDDDSQVVSDLKRYQIYKKFYVPPWEGQEKLGFYADFTYMCSVDKECLRDHAALKARLTWKSWLLLHSCIVRYLARDDGRHD